METTTTNPDHSALLPDEMRNQFVVVSGRRDAGSLLRHDLSAIWGDMSPTAYASFTANFGAKPIPELCDIYLYEGRVLDGWHRTQAAVTTGHEGLLRYYAYYGSEPARLSLILNGRRQQLSPKQRAIAAVECLYWQPPGTIPVLSRWSMSEVARAAMISGRHLHRAVICRDSGLLEVVKRDDVELEDGEAIAKSPGLLAGLSNGSVPLDEALDQVRNVRRRKIFNRRHKQTNSGADQYALDLARLEARVDQLVESRDRALSQRDSVRARLYDMRTERDALLAILNDPAVVTILDPATGQPDQQLAERLRSQPTWTVADLSAGCVRFAVAPTTAPAVSSRDDREREISELVTDGELARFNAEAVALLGFDPAVYPTIGDIGKDRPDGFSQWTRGEKNRWTRQLNRSLGRSSDLRRQLVADPD